MSAPHTDIDKQQRRHKGPIWGMVAVVVVALLALFWWMSADENAEDQAAPEVTEQTAPSDTATAPATDQSAPADTATAPATRSC